MSETPQDDLKDQKTTTEENQTSVDIASLKLELEEQKQKYMRTLAEMENARKRMQKEKQETTKFAIVQVISDFLNPLDSLEKALGFAEQMSDEVKNWAVGFKMILAQLQNVVSEHGIYPFSCKGEQFNPHFHEAVSVEETLDYPDGYILEELTKGYKSSDRVIRPAKVKVAKHPKNSEETNLEENKT